MLRDGAGALCDSRRTSRSSFLVWASRTKYAYDENGALVRKLAPAGATYFAYADNGFVSQMRFRMSGMSSRGGDTRITECTKVSGREGRPQTSHHTDRA